jgi:NTE family protein
MRRATDRSNGLVLAGGAARGAWEAGVLVYLLRHVVPEVGSGFPFRVLAGTSVGAFHASLVAAHADDPARAADTLERAWRGLVLRDALRFDPRAGAALIKGLVGHATASGHGALLDARPFERMLVRAVPFERIDAHLAAGLFDAVALSATHVATGRTTVFVADALPSRGSFGADPTLHALQVRLRAPHALASAAIPLLFPAVSIDGELYCDGGLRQLVPLRPALRLGARSLVVVSPRPMPDPPSPSMSAARERAVTSPIYLAGKALDALLLDHVDADVERLEHVNAILAAGRRRWGPGFEAELGASLGQELHTIDACVVRPSEDLGRLAALAVRSRRFADRALCHPAGRLLRALANAEASIDTDLVSYLLFDGKHAGDLIDLGVADARARHDELCRTIARTQAGPGTPAAGQGGTVRGQVRRMH